MKKIIFPVFTLVAVFAYLKFRPSITGPNSISIEAKLPMFGRISDFQLTNQNNKTISLQDFKGKAWIASFIFTRCQGPCPLISQKMARLQNELSSFENIRHVSISMDPDYDTPAVLEEYAKKYNADPSRWFFLTGNKDDIINLAIEAFKLPAGEDPNIHSTRFVLVDQDGQIRGYYDSQENNALKKLTRDIQRLNSYHITPNV